MILDKVNYPKDLKKLNSQEIVGICSEIRTILLNKLSKIGGHASPNFGIVDLTVAIHYVFDCPKDLLIFDVSHQCYAHKILTGRKEAFLDEKHFKDVSGFSNPDESEYDIFSVGHTSTSLSLAAGLMKGRDINNRKENVIAVIGDGSLSGGEAYEGLNTISEIGTNAIVIVNDNEMSIAEDHGGYYRNLCELRKTKGTSPNNLFKALGFDYYYLEEGNDTNKCIELLNKVKNTNKPVIVHVHTLKGCGYKYAEEYQERFHSNGGFNIETGECKPLAYQTKYGEFTYNYLKNRIKEDKRIVTIVSGTPMVISMFPERRKEFGKHFIDVGITEENAVAVASGIAKNGGVAVYPVFSSFFQRTYDQMSQDLAMNNSPATIIIMSGSIKGMHSKTHLGLFDISLLRSIPNIIVLCPAFVEEYEAMLNWSTTQRDYSVVIKAPFTSRALGKLDSTDYSVLNKYEVVKKGKEVALIGLGEFFSIAEDVYALLKKEDIDATLINPKFVSGVDAKTLNDLKKTTRVVVTLEDGVLDGGFGECIDRFYADSNIKVLNYGYKKEFIDQYDVNQELKKNRIVDTLILEDILKTL